MTNVIRAPFGGQPARADDVPYDADVTDAVPPAPPSDDAPESRRGGRPPSPPEAEEPPDFGLVVPLGVTTRKGQTAYVFLDAVGLQVTLSARDLFQRACLSSLFGGARGRAHLADHWPTFRPRRDERGKVIRGELEPSGDFDAEAVGNALMDACSQAGYAEAAKLRRDGIWPSGPGLLFHAGDAIILGAQKHRPGWRDGPVIYTGCAARPHPAPIAASAAAVEALRRDLDLWCYAAGPVATKLLLGLVACGMLGFAIPWRPHVFLRGPRGAGKSSLARLIAAACGAGEPSTDISAPGLRRLFDARSGLIPLDEREADAEGVRRVVEIMRGSSDGDGSVTIQADMESGGSKSWQVAGSFLFAAITLPAMTDADASRITMLQLRKLETDQRAEVDDAIARARDLHPALVRRVLDGWARWAENWPVARQAALAAQSTSRSADQVGALLAGYWTLAHDTELTVEEAAREVAELGAFLTTREGDAEAETGTLVLQHLLGSRVMVSERGSDQMTVQAAIIAAWRAAIDARAKEGQDGAIEAANQRTVWRKRLGAVGLRWEDGRARPDEWLGEGDPVPGVWIAHGSPALRALFHGSAWPGMAWREPLRDLPGVQASKGTVKFTHGGTHRATFLPFGLLGVDDADLMEVG